MFHPIDSAVSKKRKLLHQGLSQVEIIKKALTAFFSEYLPGTSSRYQFQYQETRNILVITVSSKAMASELNLRLRELEKIFSEHQLSFARIVIY